MALVPTAASRSGLTIESAAVSGPAGRQVLRIKAHADRPFQAPDVMVEAPEPFGFGRPDGAHDDFADHAFFAQTQGLFVGDFVKGVHGHLDAVQLDAGAITFDADADVVVHRALDGHEYFHDDLPDWVG